MFGFLKRKKDPPSPAAELSEDAVSDLLAIWRDDLVNVTAAADWVTPTLADAPCGEQMVFGELFCLRYFAGRFGVVTGLSDLDQRKSVANAIEALQRAMTDETSPSLPPATGRIARRLIDEHLAECRRDDPRRADAIERTRSYVPAYSVVQTRLDEYNRILVGTVPDAQRGLDEVAARFCARVGVPFSNEAHAGAFLYLSTWMNTLNTLALAQREKNLIPLQSAPQAPRTTM